MIVKNIADHFSKKKKKKKQQQQNNHLMNLLMKDIKRYWNRAKISPWQFNVLLKK